MDDGDRQNFWRPRMRYEQFVLAEVRGDVEYVSNEGWAQVVSSVSAPPLMVSRVGLMLRVNSTHVDASYMSTRIIDTTTSSAAIKTRMKRHRENPSEVRVSSVPAIAQRPLLNENSWIVFPGRVGSGRF